MEEVSQGSWEAADTDCSYSHMINSFTAPACKMSRLKHARTRLHNSIFFAPTTSTINAVRCDESPFTCQCENEDKKASGFQILHFYWSVSSDIMAMKGLNKITVCLSKY